MNYSSNISINNVHKSNNKTSSNSIKSSNLYRLFYLNRLKSRLASYKIRLPVYIEAHHVFGLTLSDAVVASVPFMCREQLEFFYKKQSHLSRAIKGLACRSVTELVTKPLSIVKNKLYESNKYRKNYASVNYRITKDRK